MKRFLYWGLVLTFLCLVALISYLITIQVSGSVRRNIPREPESGDSVSWPVGDQTEEKEPAGRTVTLIYGFEEEDQKITALILELRDIREGILNYVTIPEDTGYTLSKELYRQLAVYQPEIPQMMRLSQLYRYYGGDRAYEDGVSVMEELLHIRIDDHMVLSQKQLEKQFRKSKKGIWRIRKKILEEMTEWKEIGFYLLPGEEKNAGYEVDKIGMYRELTGILPFLVQEQKEE